MVSVDTEAMARARSIHLVFALGLGLCACSTYHDELARGQRAFDQNDHERALAIMRDLDPDTSRLDTQERARYAYVRGMSEYRIGNKSEARHWLAVAQAYDEQHPGVLPVDWKSRATETLKKLNESAWGEGRATAEK